MDLKNQHRDSLSNLQHPTMFKISVQVLADSMVDDDSETGKTSSSIFLVVVILAWGIEWCVMISVPALRVNKILFVSLQTKGNK